MVKPALLSLSADSPNRADDNNQITVTLKSADAERRKYCSFQVGRADLRKLVEDYAGDGFFTQIQAKLKA